MIHVFHAHQQTTKRVGWPPGCSCRQLRGEDIRVLIGRGGLLWEGPEKLDFCVVREVAPLLLAGVLEGFVFGGGGDDVDTATKTVLLAGLDEVPRDLGVRVGSEMRNFLTAGIGDHFDHVLGGDEKGERGREELECELQIDAL